MIKCPNCGSAAQQHYIINRKGEIGSFWYMEEIKYRCKFCKQSFVYKKLYSENTGRTIHSIYKDI